MTIYPVGGVYFALQKIGKQGGVIGRGRTMVDALMDCLRKVETFSITSRFLIED